MVLGTGVISTAAELALEARVQLIYDGVDLVLRTHAPSLLVLEDLYTEYRFPRTALLMAHARGVICLAARQCDVTLLTLAPAVENMPGPHSTRSHGLFSCHMIE